MKHSGWMQITLFTVLSVTGCTTFQTPETLGPGEFLLGGGIAATAETENYRDVQRLVKDVDKKVLWLRLLEPETWGGLGAVYGRIGLTERVDAGFKIEALPPSPLFSLLVDVKYQVVQSTNVAASLDLGAFVYKDGEELYGKQIGVVPMVLVGNGKVHGGAKAKISTEGVKPGFLVGLSLFWRRSRILMELNVDPLTITPPAPWSETGSWTDQSDPEITLGVALQRTFDIR